MKPIRNYNKKGQYHGYNERHYDDKITMRGNFINENMIGYTEHHWSKITRFNII